MFTGKEEYRAEPGTRNVRGLSWVRALLFREEGAIFDSLACLCDSLDSLTKVQELFHGKCHDCNNGVNGNGNNI